MAALGSCTRVNQTTEEMRCQSRVLGGLVFRHEILAEVEIIGNCYGNESSHSVVCQYKIVMLLSVTYISVCHNHKVKNKYTHNKRLYSVLRSDSESLLT